MMDYQNFIGQWYSADVFNKGNKAEIISKMKDAMAVDEGLRLYAKEQHDSLNKMLKARPNACAVSSVTLKLLDSVFNIGE